MSKSNFILHPSKSRSLGNTNVHTNQSGSFIISPSFLNDPSEYVSKQQILANVGIGNFYDDDIYDLSFKYKKSSRNFISNELNYFIVIQTLR